MGRLQRRRVVDAVASHRDDFAAGTKGLHQTQFLFGLDAAEDVRVASRARSSSSLSAASSAPVMTAPSAGSPTCRATEIAVTG